MNEVLLNEDLGREHIEELIREAEQERLAQKVAKTQHRKPWLTRVRALLLKAISSFAA